jgi:hypothetical protein
MTFKNYSPQSTPNQGERIDELERYYKPIEQIDDINSWLFWASAILSIAVFFKGLLPWKALQDTLEISFVLLVIFHLILSIYVRYHLLPIAERKRRRQLLSDSFAVPLIIETTQKYYNNEISPSIARLGANVLENTLFAKNITAKMAIRERIKILIYVLIWALAMFWRTTNLGLLVVITQTIFSSEIIEGWIRIEVLRNEAEKFYDELYSNFLHKVDLTNSDGIASILDLFASYEATKSMTAIRQLRSIFMSSNPELSQEWDTTRERLGISNPNHKKKVVSAK